MINERTFAAPNFRHIGEQLEIVAILNAIDCRIDLHRRKRTVLDELFKALLQQLLTGDIRVADLDLSALEAKPTAEVHSMTVL